MTLQSKYMSLIKEIYKEAKQLADRGLIPVVQKLGYNEKAKRLFFTRRYLNDVSDKWMTHSPNPWH